MLHKLQYNNGAAVQDDEAQQCWYSTILAANAISNNGKFVKMVHLDFFGEDGGRSPHHSNLENYHYFQNTVSPKLKKNSQVGSKADHRGAV